MSERVAVGAHIGPFRLVAQLGEGGFAPVYLAAEEYGGVEIRIVALKLFFTARVGAAAFEQVIAEARALSRVEHRNVVRYFQIFEDKAAGIVALAMEHVRGDSLSRRVENHGTLPLADALAVGAAIASALVAVHATGLVHRDIKPENVIDAGGVYKLIDFGIATVARKARTGLPPAAPFVPVPMRPAPIEGGTEQQERTLVLAAPHNTAPFGLGDTATFDEGGSELIAGTMGYIDPECLKGAPPDPSSDLYGLGAMLYECLSGRLPATPKAQSTKIHQGIAFGIEPPPPLRELLPDIPEAVARLVDALIDPDRARRPRHAEAVLAELERLRRGVGRPRTLPEEGPFRGLSAFDERHRDVFFGRSNDLANALEALRTRGVLALIGPSGSGKSSLARAGVLPSIVDGELGTWPKKFESVMLRPGLHPRAALDFALARIMGVGSVQLAPDAFVTALGTRVETTGTGIVLYLDALEELVTLSQPAEREWVAEVIARLARSPVPGVRAVVSARRDFLDRLLALASLGPTLARSVQLVAPLGGRAFAEAVEDRLAVYGFSLEDRGMFDEVARELDGAPEAMPLFEFALARLWNERDPRERRLPRAALVRIGGITGALEQHAENAVAVLTRQYGPPSEAGIRAVLLALTTASGTRTRRTPEEVAAETKLNPAQLTAILGAFEQARLVVVEDGKLTLAHEALLERWPRLRHWVSAVRKERELAEEVEQAAAKWNERHQERSLLVRGRPLREANELLRSRATSLSANARTFLRASKRAEMRGITGAVVLVGCVVVGLILLYGRAQALESDARKKEKSAEEVVTTFQKTRTNTSQAERAAAMKDLIEAKAACENELKKRARCGDADGGVE